MRSLFSLLCFAVLLCSCYPSRKSATPPGYIDNYGSHPAPTGTLVVEVTRREKSLVDFEVIDQSTGKSLYSDYVGSDAMRWFLWWETPTRLWGYGSDLGYFKVIDFTSGSAKSSSVSETKPIPQFIWDQLPERLQSIYQVAAPTKKE